MASAISLQSRLDRLLAAVPRVQATERGAMLSAQPMARLLSVTWPTLREWVDDYPALVDFGAVVRGGSGIEYEFDPRLTVVVLIGEFRLRIEREGAKSKAAASVAGVQLSSAEPAPSLAETKQQVELTLAVVGARERTGGYVPRERMIDFVVPLFQRLTEAILGVRTRVDPNGNLPPSVRGKMDEYLRSVATQVHAEATKFIEEHREGSQQSGVVRTGKAAR